MLLQDGFGMWKVIALVLMAALPALAQPVSVAQLQQTLGRLKSARASDSSVAEAISSFELTEHLTSLTLERIKAESTPGRKTLLSLELLSYSSSFLDPPSVEMPEKAPPDPRAEQSMLSAAMNYVATTLRHMPDFLATRITRSFDNSSKAIPNRGTYPSELQLMGTASQEITYRNGKETVLETTSQNHKSNEQESGPGLTSKGEFGPILATVLGDSFKGTVTWSHWEQTAAGLAAVFHYEVPSGASHYVVDFCCENNDFPNFPGSFYHGTPAYHGSLYIDPITGAILRVTLEAELSPSGPLMSSEVSVEYGSVDIGGKSYICPIHSVEISSSLSYLAKYARDTTILRLNEVVFTNYHRFGSSARVLDTAPAQ